MEDDRELEEVPERIELRVRENEVLGRSKREWSEG